MVQGCLYPYNTVTGLEVSHNITGHLGMHHNQVDYDTIAWFRVLLVREKQKHCWHSLPLQSRRLRGLFWQPQPVMWLWTALLLACWIEGFGSCA